MINFPINIGPYFKFCHLFVLRNIQEALDDLNWKLVALEEINALKKSGTWETCPEERKLSGVNGFSLLSVKLMVVWKGTRRDLWRKVLRKHMALIIKGRLRL